MLSFKDISQRNVHSLIILIIGYKGELVLEHHISQIGVQMKLKIIVPDSIIVIIRFALSVQSRFVSMVDIRGICLCFCVSSRLGVNS